MKRISVLLLAALLMLSLASCGDKTKATSADPSVLPTDQLPTGEAEGSGEASVPAEGSGENSTSEQASASSPVEEPTDPAAIPVFSVNATAATCGDVVILSASNVLSGGEISVKIEPSLDYTPTFYQVGDSWQALLPLAVDAVESGDATYTIKMSTANGEDTFSLKVSALAKGEYNYYESKSQFEPYYNDASIEALRTNMKDVALSASGSAFTGGKFVVPAKDNYYSETSNYPFGTRVTLTGLNKSFTALDTMYCAMARTVKDENGKTTYVEGTKTKVLAAFDGKVVYVGSQTYTGRLVVIDHGSGLKSWYSNLSSDIQVKVGDTVTAGQVISSAADGGLNASLNFNFHVGVTVHGVPVNIQTLIDKGLNA